MTTVADVTAPATPFKGLRPYTAADEAFFFGRDAEAQSICEHLLAYRLTLLYGPSGVGKSSLLAAGVKAQLDEEARGGPGGAAHPEQFTVVFPSTRAEVGDRRDSWRDDPLVAIPEAVREAVREAGVDVELTDGTDAFADRLCRWSETLDAEIFLILDQFEEYILYHGGEDGPGTLATELPRCVATPGLGVNVLIAIREDAFTRLDRFKDRIPLLYEHQLRLEHLSRDAARTAIFGPVARYNGLLPDEQAMTVDDDLAEAVLDQVQSGAVTLGRTGRGTVEHDARARGIEAPFLQLVMERLWAREQELGSRFLRRSTLEDLGGAKRIVRTHLESVMNELPEASRQIAALVFKRLVTPSGTKIAYVPSDLAKLEQLDPEQVGGVLDRLTDDRLLTQIAPPAEAGEPRYEIFHDVLAPAVLDWSARWLQAQRFADEQQKLDAERDAVRRQAERDRRAARRLRGWTVVAVLFALAAIAAAVYAQASSRKAERNAREATDTRETLKLNNRLRDAEGKLATDPAMALTGVRAVARDRRSKVPEAAMVTALRRTLQASTLIAVLNPKGERPVRAAVFSPRGDYVVTAVRRQLGVWSAAGRPLAGVDLPAQVHSIAFNPDGTAVAAGLDGGDTVVWHWRSGRQERFPGTGRPIVAVAFTADGKRVVGANVSTATTWRLGTAGRGVGRAVDVNSNGGLVVLAPDGTRVLAGLKEGERDAARIIDVPSGRVQRLRWPHSSRTPTTAAFSADGRYVVLGSSNAAVAAAPADPFAAPADAPRPYDAYVALWGPRSAHPISYMTSSTTVTSVALARDHRDVAFGSDDGVVRTWRARGNARGQSQRVMRDHTDRVTRIAFSADARWLLTAAADRTARLWSVAGGREVVAFRGHEDAVGVAAFDGKGERVLTAGDDGTARLWRLGVRPPTVRLPFRGNVYAMSASADGKQMLEEGFEGMRLIDVATSRRTPWFGEGEWFVTFTPRDERVVSVSDTRYTIRGLDGREIDHRSLRLSDFPTASPSGAAVLFTTAKGLRVLDAETGELTSPLKVPRLGGYFVRVALTPDGDRVAIETRKGLSVWDITARKKLRDVNLESFKSVALSPDGQRLLIGSAPFEADSAGRAGTTVMIDVATGRRTVLRTPDAATVVAFSPRGSRFAVTGGDNTARIFDPARPNKPLMLSGHRGGITDIAFNRDGTLIATSSQDGSARVWDAGSGDLVQPLRQDSTTALYNIGFTADGRRVVVQDGGASYFYDCELCGTRQDLLALADARVPLHP